MPPSRGRNCDPAEDLELARAWVRVSTDAATGVNQTAEVFWTRVRGELEASDPIAAGILVGTYESRSWTSLQSHFKDMSKKVSKFVRCTKKIELLHESGTTERDALVKAHELYRAETKTVFQYQACYAVLSACPKFQKVLVSPGKRKSPDAVSTALSEVEEAVEASRQGNQGEANGVKASKKRRGQEQLQARAVEAQEKLTATMESKTKLAKARLRIQEEQALQSMLNELYSAQARDAEHARFLEDRRYSLLQRLTVFDSPGLAAPSAPGMRISVICTQLPEEADGLDQ